MSKTRILVVEDGSIVALELRERLQSLGYAVAGIVSYGEDAVRRAEEARPDLVLMDIRLKGEMDGIEAAEEIRARLGIPVIYLTAYADEDTLRRARVTEPYGYIIKPFQEAALHTAIEVALYKHRMEEKLKESQRRLAAMLRHIEDAVVATDEKGLVTCMNPRAEALTGWKQEEAIGRDVAEVISLRGETAGILSQESVRRAFREHLGFNQVGDLFLIARDGREIPIDGHIAPMRDERGTLTGVIWAFRDISRRRAAEETLRRSEREKAAVLDIMSELVIYQDAEMRVLWTNQAAGRSVDMAPEQLVGQRCYAIWHRRDVPCEGCPAIRARETGQPQEAEITTPDGRTWLVRCYPIADAQGDVADIVEVMLDVTAHRQAEEEREKLQAELFQAQKMEAIGRLASGVAHEFNNYLTVIMGNGQFLLSDLPPDDPRRLDAEEILSVAHRAAAVTRQLLAFSRPQALALRVVDLNELVADLEKMLGRLLGESIHLVTMLSPALHRVRADPGQMEQAILNLVVNARDAMPEGGVLTIRTENVALDEAQCAQMPEARPGQFVRLSVSDTGIGMDEEVIAHIFEPYFTTKGTEKGVGLGLSVVYGIVQKHEGWIHVSSRPGRGSTFRVYLPACSNEMKVPAAERDPSLASAPRGRGEGILLVEDEGKVRKFVTRLLEGKGYVVFEAATMAEALEVFEREREWIHLVFSDVVLPDGTGLQLVDRLLPRREDLRVLLSSGYGDDRARWSAAEERGFPFVQKPYQSSQLLHIIRKTLEG